MMTTICGITERERKSYLSTIEFYKEKSKRQGHTIAVLLDFLHDKGNQQCENDVAIYDLLRKHFDDEINRLKDVKRKIENENN